MNRIAGVICLAAFGSVIVDAQSNTPAFDVASVRLAAPEQKGGSKSRIHRVHTTPGNLVMRNIGMDEAICWAYNVEPYQLTGPSWMSETRFDIVAKAAGPATDDEMRVMAQTLFASRFGLATHRDKKEMSGMVLLVNKGGSHMKASEEQGESVFEPQQKKMAIDMRRMSMHEFATLLSEPMRKPVVDQTELLGFFDFTIDASNYVPPEPTPGQPREDNETYMVMRALQDQLGLRLEARKLNINMLIVDRLEKVPTEN